jgi:acetate kinase
VCSSDLEPKLDADVAQRESPARIFVIHTQEELMVAQEARRVMGARV